MVHSAEEICQENTIIYTASLDVDSLPSDTPLDENIDTWDVQMIPNHAKYFTCNDKLYNDVCPCKVLKDNFNIKFYKHIDCVATGSIWSSSS